MFNQVLCVADIRRCYAVRDPTSSKSRAQTTTASGPLALACVASYDMGWPGIVLATL